MVGAGGSEIWTFKAVGRGRTVVRLKCVRPWEQDVPPVEIAEYEILVQ
jgi:predicted secreted protein